MRIAWLWATAVLLALASGRTQGGVLEPSLTDSAGAKLLASYLGAIAAGDSVAAGRCWARESLERPGFWQTLHIEIGRMNDASGLREMLAGHTAVVTGTRPEPEGWRLEFEWRPAAGLAADLSDAPSRMHFYVIRQDGRFVFINPVDLLPRAWTTRDEGVCVFHYPEELSSADADTQMRFMDARCREVTRYLGADSTQKIDVYVVDSAETVGELVLYPRSGGYCLAERRLIVSPTFVNPHEFVHFVTMPQGSLLVNGPIGEGIAVALGGTHASTPDFCLVQTRNFLGDSLYVPLPEMIAGEESVFFDNAEVTYHEAGAWVRFLLDRYGYSRLVEWDRRCRSGTAIRNAFREVYGSSLEELEAPWKQWVAEYDLPSVGTQVPADADPVLSMTDAAGDDDGDGTYRYPTDPGFRDGALDLRKFEVLRDERHAYFRLEFAEKGEPVKDEATGHSYTPGAILALQRSRPARPDLSHSLEGISFAGGQAFDLQINVGTGIMVYDAFKRSLVASRALRRTGGSGSGRSVEFSLPSSFLGSPNSEWKYFVGAVLMDDETLDYLRSYPEPVTRSEARFAISGGEGQDTGAVHGSPAPRVPGPEDAAWRGSATERISMRSAAPVRRGRRLSLTRAGTRARPCDVGAGAGTSAHAGPPVGADDPNSVSSFGVGHNHESPVFRHSDGHRAVLARGMARPFLRDRARMVRPPENVARGPNSPQDASGSLPLGSLHRGTSGAPSAPRPSPAGPWCAARETGAHSRADFG